MARPPRGNNPAAAARKCWSVRTMRVSLISISNADIFRVRTVGYRGGVQRDTGGWGRQLMGHRRRGCARIPQWQAGPATAVNWAARRPRRRPLPLEPRRAHGQAAPLERPSPAMRATKRTSKCIKAQPGRQPGRPAGARRSRADEIEACAKIGGSARPITGRVRRTTCLQARPGQTEADHARRSGLAIDAGPRVAGRWVSKPCTLNPEALHWPELPRACALGATIRRLSRLRDIKLGLHAVEPGGRQRGTGRLFRQRMEPGWPGQ